MNNLLDKIIALKNKFANSDIQDVSTIDSWLVEAKRLILLNDLMKHDGVKYVLEKFESEVKTINQALLKSDSKKIPDRERDRMIDKRDLALSYINLFKTVPLELEKLSEIVDNETDSSV